MQATKELESPTKILPAESLDPKSILALKEAMKYTVDMLTLDLDFSKIDPSVFEKEIENTTAGRCLEGCLAATSYLYENYSELFEIIALLHYEKFETTKQNKPIGVFHEYFLARDNTGIWHAASPANHERQSGENSRLRRIFSSQNLGQVLDSIEEFEGGKWPTEQYIVDVLKRLKSPSRTYNGRAEIIQFVKENTGNEYEVTKYLSPTKQPSKETEF